MQWSHHISSMCSKANRSLNFLRRNLSKCSSDIKENAYLTIVRPTLEYAACVWDPYQEYLIYVIEKILHAARWVLSIYRYYSNVMDMLNHLKWLTLQERRHVNRLSQFHKIVHSFTPSIQLPSYILPTQFPARQLHQHHFITPVSSTLMLFFSKHFKRMEQLTKQNH